MKKYSLEDLRLINNIEFTNREIDILACIVNGRSPKVIGSFLSVSTRTVETHLYNVMKKMACTSRQYIINFIENSDKEEFFQQHYHTLLTRSHFDIILKEIRSIITQKNLKCELAFYEDNKSQLHTNLLNLEKDLKSAGIQVNVLKKTNINPDLIFITFITQDKNIEDTFSKQTLKKDDIYSNYYLTFFSIIKKILPTHSFEKDTKNFLNTHQKKKDFSPYEKSQLNSYKKLLYFSSKTKVLTGIILFFFSIFLVYKLVPLQNTSKNVSYELQIPNKTYILERNDLILTIEHKLKNQEKIKTVALVGIAGSGKTILARQYAIYRNPSFTFEIDASAKTTTISSFKDLAYNLAQTNQEKIELEIIQRIKDQICKEKQILLFVKKKLRDIKNWILLFDNLENFSDIQEYFPMNSNIWGNGSVIITTQNANIIGTSYISADHIIFINELSKADVLCLFNKILSGLKHNSNRKKETLAALLATIPPFPLDVSIVAYYIKNTHISYEDYLRQIKDLDLVYNHILKEGGDYKRIRHELIINSIKKILDINPEFSELLALIFLLDSQNIPLDLLENFKNPTISHQFLYHLKKYSLIYGSFSDFSQFFNFFSIHRSTQRIGGVYILGELEKNKNKACIRALYSTLKKYAYKILDENNFHKIKSFFSHWEIVLTHNHLLPSDMKAEFFFILGEFYLQLNNYTRAQETFKNNLYHLNKSSPSHLLLIAYNTARLGNTYKFLGDYKNAKKYLEKSLTIYDKNNFKNDIGYARILVDLGKVLRISGEYEQAKIHTNQALSIYEKLFPNNYKDIANALTSLGSIYRLLGDYKKSISLLEKSIFIYKNHLGKNHEGLCWAITQLGVTNSACGNYRQAKALLENSVSLYKNFPEKKRELAHTLSFLGYVYKKLGDLKTAHKLFKESLFIFKKYFGDEYPENVWTLAHLGILQKTEGNFKKAESLLKKSLDIFKTSFSPTYTEVGWMLAHLGILACESGNYTKAESLLKEGYKIYSAAIPEVHTNGAWILTELGITYLYLGELEKAQKTIEHAQSIYKQVLGENNVKTSWSSVCLARVYMNTGNHKKAKELLEESLKLYQSYFGLTHPRTIKIVSLLSEIDTYNWFNIFRRRKN